MRNFSQRRNPRTPKTQKMAEEEEVEVRTESENSESSSSDDPKTPENKTTEYEKQRELVIARNKARMESMGLQKIAKSLMNLGHKEGKKRKSQHKSIKSKKDDEYEPDNDDEEQKDDSSEATLDNSSEEFEQEKKKKKITNARNSKSHSKKVEPPQRVLIPDSSLEFMGHCGEQICIVFPKAPEKDVKELMDSYPKGFEGFSREEAERTFKWIARLKAEYYKLRRSQLNYPESREEFVEGLPFPEGFTGFNLEESKQISGVIVALEIAYSRMKKFFQSDVEEIAKHIHPSVHPEASASHPMWSSHPPATQASCFQQHPSTWSASAAQQNSPMFPGYWCSSMNPFGMFANPWNPCNANFVPYMGNFPVMPPSDAQKGNPYMRPPSGFGSS
ncbi:uncharacterized protein LOC104905352 isoform X1 [Beta vulgaris subsp. vulgaris]|uniref:uncharacterized protein LOC104905352 isoform X1 n=1 Tax=Beta vulgaris subsp. vulgaris TaxID=3555 RepID=UPI0020369493|nr:uncharacterized protein LOC104905352 isoform X1 [Beta vulgaris subsp. vulgaris]